jgi:hypothetical protein
MYYKILKLSSETNVWIIPEILKKNIVKLNK